VDDDGIPLKISRLAIEHKVVSEKDTGIIPIKEHDANVYRWMRRRFALQFEELSGKTQGSGRIGTPLNKANILPEAILTQFLSQGVTTVEALAYMTDNLLANFGPGMRMWRDRAQDWLNAKDQARELEELRDAYEAAEAAETEEAAKPKRKPGRPKKTAESAPEAA
jgi:hypothetical protein